MLRQLGQKELAHGRGKRADLVVRVALKVCFLKLRLSRCRQQFRLSRGHPALEIESAGWAAITQSVSSCSHRSSSGGRIFATSEGQIISARVAVPLIVREYNVHQICLGDEIQ